MSFKRDGVRRGEQEKPTRRKESSAPRWNTTLLLLKESSCDSWIPAPELLGGKASSNFKRDVQLLGG